MKYFLTLTFLFSLFLIPISLLGQDISSDDAQIDVSSIKEVIENDRLADVVSQKNIELKKAQEEKEKKEVGKYLFPENEDFWHFISEYWIIKNAKLLGWDVIRPEYGLDDSFKVLLENLGYYHQKFNILLVDSSEVCHFALPSKKGSYIFIVSVPFMRTMNLSKLEISLLMFEDLIRKNRGQFIQHASIPELKDWLGKNYFEKKKIDEVILDKILANYDDLIFKKGFSFQEQYEVTKMVFNNIEKDDVLLSTYKNLLHKVDALVKTNDKFKNYVKIYPSPELQLGWVETSKKNI